MAANTKKDFSLDQKATATAFGQLVGISQQAVSKHVSNGVLTKGGTFRTWFREYVEHLREQASGRGGEHQEQLTIARMEESRTKGALNRLQYFEKLGHLVQAEDVARALDDWAGYANREYISAMDRLVASIEGEHQIKVDAETVNSIAESTTRGIAEYAEELGEAFVAGIESVSPEGEGSDG